MKKTATKRKQISLHADAALAEDIREIAKREHRSVSAQIALFLRDAVARHGTADATRPI